MKEEPKPPHAKPPYRAPRKLAGFRFRREILLRGSSGTDQLNEFWRLSVRKLRRPLISGIKSDSCWLGAEFSALIHSDEIAEFISDVVSKGCRHSGTTKYAERFTPIVGIQGEHQSLYINVVRD